MFYKVGQTMDLQDLKDWIAPITASFVAFIGGGVVNKLKETNKVKESLSELSHNVLTVQNDIREIKINLDIEKHERIDMVVSSEKKIYDEIKRMREEMKQDQRSFIQEIRDERREDRKEYDTANKAIASELAKIIFNHVSANEAPHED